MPIAEPDRTKGTIAEGLDGGKGMYRGCRGEKGWSMWEEERDRVEGDGQTALCVAALSGNLDCREIPQTDLRPAELKNCDCVLGCFLISGSWRSSGKPARDLSSSLPLNNAVLSLSWQKQNTPKTSR